SSSTFMTVLQGRAWRGGHSNSVHVVVRRAAREGVTPCFFVQTTSRGRGFPTCFHSQSRLVASGVVMAEERSEGSESSGASVLPLSVEPALSGPASTTKGCSDASDATDHPDRSQSVPAS